MARLDAQIDGDYFADYIHAVANSSLEMSARKCCCRLIELMVGRSPMERLIRQFGGNRPELGNRGALADALFAAMGWQAIDYGNPEPLISHATTFDLEGVRSGRPTKVKTVLKSLQSFCKDVLEVLAYKHGNSQENIWAAIDSQNSPYNPISSRKIWREEIARCTVKSGSTLIERLGQAPAEMADACKALADGIGDLDASLHLLMDRNATAPGIEVEQEIGNQIRRIVNQATEVLGEVPWHFSPTVQFGRKPWVLSGVGWSHAEVAPRLLRVISMFELLDVDETLIWNPSGTGSLIGDPTFLSKYRYRARATTF
jgi:hypothetical protein